MTILTAQIVQSNGYVDSKHMTILTAKQNKTMTILTAQTEQNNEYINS